MLYLLATGHAVLRPIDPEDGPVVVGCPDRRMKKDMLVFGGSSAFTFGWYWFVAVQLVGDSTLADVFQTYGVLQLILSAFQLVSYLIQLRKSTAKVVYIKSHLEGCGFTTAWSMIWPLFWIQKIPFMKWVVRVRDIATVVEFIASFPAMIIICVLTMAFYGKVTVPMITHIDHND